MSHCLSSLARVMIAQWENECISLSVLSMTWVMIAQWENECLTVCPLRGQGSIPGRDGIFQGNFLWLITHTW